MENNFIYCVDYSHEGNYSCAEHGCNDEGICRCYAIESIDIHKIYIPQVTDQIFSNLFKVGSNSWRRDESLNKILFNIDSAYLDAFYKYCIDRILVLNKAYDTNLWIGERSGGYYGDEVESISMDHFLFKKIEEDLDTIFGMAEISDMVQFLLEKEYGHVLDKLKDKEYSVEAVDRSQIVFPQDNHQSRVSQEDLSYVDSYRSSDIAGICLKELDRYRVIDGYHRLTHLTKKQPKILIITIC